MKYVIFIGCLAFLLIGCGSPAAPATQAAIIQPTLEPTAVPTVAPTSTPIPPTATPVPLDEILIMPGDLPAGYSGAQIRTEAPGMFKALPGTDTALYQQFQSGGKVSGGVTLFIYENESDLKNAYTIVKGGFAGTKSLDGLGDEADVSTSAMLPAPDLVFRHCKALVHIRMSDGADESGVVAYAKRLDKRIQPIACQ